MSAVNHSIGILVRGNNKLTASLVRAERSLTSFRKTAERTARVLNTRLKIPRLDTRSIQAASRQLSSMGVRAMIAGGLIVAALGLATRSASRFEYAMRGGPVASASLVVSNVHGEWEGKVEEGNTLLLQWGYGGDTLHPLFTGYVDHAYVDEKVHISAVCLGIDLVNTRVTRTYKNMNLSSIVEHLISPRVRSGSRYVVAVAETLDTLPLCNNTIVQALELINYRTGGGYVYYFGPDGIFHWELTDEAQPPAARFTYGENIIELSPQPEGWLSVSVFGAPIWHSQVVEVVHRDGAVRSYLVEMVKHTVGVGGSGARSRLLLREVGS